MVCETLLLEARLNNVDAYLVIVYRSHSSSIQEFFEILHEQRSKVQSSNKPFFLFERFQHQHVRYRVFGDY